MKIYIELNNEDFSFFMAKVSSHEFLSKKYFLVVSLQLIVSREKKIKTSINKKKKREKIVSINGGSR